MHGGEMHGRARCVLVGVVQLGLPPLLGVGTDLGDWVRSLRAATPPTRHGGQQCPWHVWA
eukprot:801048-Heterocapsa_arctica.AAC.1